MKQLIDAISAKVIESLLGTPVGTTSTSEPKQDDQFGLLGKKCIVRSYDAGVYFGEIGQFDPVKRIAKLKDARNIYYWDGAAGLSQIAVDGLSSDNCKVTKAVESQIVLNVIQILECSALAITKLSEIKAWAR